MGKRVIMLIYDAYEEDYKYAIVHLIWFQRNFDIDRLERLIQESSGCYSFKVLFVEEMGLYETVEDYKPRLQRMSERHRGLL